MNALIRAADSLTEPEQGERFILQRLPTSFGVRWFHDTLTSAQTAKALCESRGMKVRILRVSLVCEEVP